MQLLWRQRLRARRLWGLRVRLRRAREARQGLLRGLGLQLRRMLPPRGWPCVMQLPSHLCRRRTSLKRTPGARIAQTSGYPRYFSTRLRWLQMWSVLTAWIALALAWASRSRSKRCLGRRCHVTARPAPCRRTPGCGVWSVGTPLRSAGARFGVAERLSGVLARSPRSERRGHHCLVRAAAAHRAAALRPAWPRLCADGVCSPCCRVAAS